MKLEVTKTFRNKKTKIKTRGIEALIWLRTSMGDSLVCARFEKKPIDSSNGNASREG